MKVKDVLDEIKKLESHAESISNMAIKMIADKEAEMYMFNTFHIDIDTLHEIATDIRKRIMILKEKLNECEVNID